MAELHHIVFRSQGGLNFKLNLIPLSIEEHKGDDGPHKNRQRDLELKQWLQEQLFDLFDKEKSYTLNEIAIKLGMREKSLYKPFKSVEMTAGEYIGLNVVKRLMGGRFY